MSRKSSLRGYVLVVDDEEHNRMLLVDTLEAWNYEVAEAVDGAQALAMARTRVPDVILLDVMMPNMDGFVACRELKGDPATAAWDSRHPDHRLCRSGGRHTGR